MIAFNKYYNHFNYISGILIICSLVLLVFKGLNFGIDFKGGTLIELRSSDNKINVSSPRDKFSQMDLGDVSVKKFGNDTDYLIKFENKDNKKNVIEEIKANLDKSFGNNFNFRRVENVGPKVSAELLRSGVIAISVALSWRRASQRTHRACGHFSSHCLALQQSAGGLCSRLPMYL